MNFDKVNVTAYDSDREIPISVLNNIIKFIQETFPIKHFPSLLEPGIGTGRWAIPLAKVGYTVTGFDISQMMLDELLRKLQNEPGLKINIHLQDISQLKQDDHFYNLCIVSHLFHLIENLEKTIDLIVNALSPKDGALIHIKSGKGNSIPELSKLYVEELKKHNYSLNSFSEKVDKAFYLIKQKGFQQQDIEDKDWQWVNKIKIERGLQLLKLKSFSFTNLPDEKTHELILNKVQEDCIKKYGTLSYEIEVINKIKLSIFKKI